MCKVLKVSISGYYYWRKHPIGSRQTKEAQQLSHIQTIHKASHGRYGSPRIADELKEQGVKASRNRVARLMSKANIKSIISKKYRVQNTDTGHANPVANNLLARDFLAERLSQKWVSDMTYIPTGEGWLYLTGTPERTILDLADRKVVGWSMSETLKTTDTSVAAWQMAIKNRPIEGELLFHRSGDPAGSRDSIRLHGVQRSLERTARLTKHEPERKLPRRPLDLSRCTIPR